MKGGAEKRLNYFKAWLSPAMERAKEIQANLSQEHPSFIKVMTRSCVSYPFSMFLPSEFYQKHIRKADQSVVLEVENGNSYDVKILGSCGAFSAGWRALSIAEQLLENDILVFQLTGPYKFKVYTVRASRLSPTEEAHEVIIDDCVAAKAVEKKRECESDKKNPGLVRVKVLGENIKASSSSIKKSIHSNDNKSSNMKGNNSNNSEKIRGSLGKSSNPFKASSSKAMEAAKEIQGNLSPEHPSFIKLMTKSYVSQPSALRIPSQFCQKHLPRSNEVVALEVESGQTYDVKLLGAKDIFSSRWKLFCEAEKLQENDVLVFYLVEPCKFKVYIVRANGVVPVDKSPTVDKIDDSTTSTKKVERIHAVVRENKRLKLVAEDIIMEKVKVGDSVMKKSTLITSRKSLNVQDCPSIQNTSDFEVDGTIQFHKQVMNQVESSRGSKKRSAQTSIIKISSDSRPSTKDEMKKAHMDKQQPDGFGVEGVVDRAEKSPLSDAGFAEENGLGQQKISENPDTQFMHVPSSENVKVMNTEVYNSFLVENSHYPSHLIPSSEDDVKPPVVVSDYKDFRIIFDCTDITLAIKPARTRLSYFYICRARDAYLHRHLIGRIDVNHAVFVITQTAKIANAIKNCNMLTTEKEIVYWRKALESFSIVGMDVGFMLARVKRLWKLKSTDAKTVDGQKDEEAKVGEEKLEERIRALESKIEKIREKRMKIEDEKEVARKKAEELKCMFLLEASAPW